MEKINLKNFKKNNIFWLVLSALLLVPAAWALFVPGFYGASDDIHIAWLFEMHKILMSGQIPPRFVPDLSFGFGYPLFNFVFPLPFYLAEIFHLLGFNLVDSIKALFFLSLPLSGIFMYLMLRQFISKGLSLSGAILYIYTPYRSTDLYVRGAIGEIVSFIFLPLIVLSVIKLSVYTPSSIKNTLSWIGIGALSLAGLILTHNITAYMFFPFVMLFWLLRIFFLAPRNKQNYIVLFSTIFLGLLISCYFWVPALLDSNLMKYDTVFNFADHFPTLMQLIKPYWGYGASVPGPYDGMSFFLGIANIAILIIGIFLTIIFWSKFSKDKKILLVWAFICIFFAVFLMNYRSTFLWRTIPLLPFFQFPWRFLILTTFSIPIFVVTLDKFPFVRYTPFFVILLTLTTSGSYFRPQDFLERKDNYFLDRYIPIPFASLEYFKTREEYLRLPKYTDTRPDKNYPPVYTNSGKINNVIRINDLNALVEVNSEGGMRLNYSKYYFPGWIAKIDNQDTPIIAGIPFGQISVTVSPGAHKVEFLFKETNFKKLLDAISLGCFLVSLWLVKNLWIRSKKIGRFW